MTTLISLIGKSKADPQTGYRKAHYSFEPGFSRTVSFFGLALLDYAKPERLILACAVTTATPNPCCKTSKS
ncbi:MAG: hypothetical protein PHE74_08765 [Comamonas sp.]|nr:hypothetical protein [Comamonas sp.]